jgi:hypothetical protein
MVNQMRLGTETHDHSANYIAASEALGKFNLVLVRGSNILAPNHACDVVSMEKWYTIDHRNGNGRLKRR